MSYDELLNFVKKKNNGEQIYYVCIDGSIYKDSMDIFPSEKQIYAYIEKKLKKNINDFRKYQQQNSDQVSNYLEQNPWFLNYAEESINNLDLSLIDFNISIGDGALLVIRINDKDITIQGIEVTFIRENNYKVDIYDIPVNKYILEQLKFISKINITKEPRIPLKLNPGITKQDIQEAKRMVKSLKNNQKCPK